MMVDILYLNLDLNSAVGELLNHTLDPYKRLHRGVEAVGHELTLSVRGDEGDGSIVLEARQTDTLMELDILQLYRLTLLS